MLYKNIIFQRKKFKLKHIKKISTVKQCIDSVISGIVIKTHLTERY